MKRFFSLMLSMAMVIGMTLGAYAQQIGTVDYEKLIRSYNKATSFNDDLKIKEGEIEKMKAEFVKQLRETKNAQPDNPVALEQMEKQLQERLNAKINETRNWMASKSQEIDTSMNTAIQDVARTKNLDVVVAKQAVLYGGTDITNDVLGRLNTK